VPTRISQKFCRDLHAKKQVGHGRGEETTLVRVTQGAGDIGKYMFLNSATLLLSYRCDYITEVIPQNMVEVKFPHPSLKTQPRRP